MGGLLAARRLATVSLGVLLLVSACSAKSHAVSWAGAEDYPDPQTDVALCGRGVPSRICDPDGILTKQGADVLEGIIKLIAQGEDPFVQASCQTAGLKGYEVGVALARHLHVPLGVDAATAVQRFAKQLHNKWGVGGSTCQTGVLLAVALDNRQLYISTGKGVSEQLPPRKLDDIIDMAKPLLREQKYDEAVQGLVANIGDALAGRPLQPSGTGEHRSWSDWLFGALCWGFLGLLGLACWGSWSHGRRAQGRFRDCKALLERIKKDQAALQADAYAVTSCPICLEDFTPDTNSNGEVRLQVSPEEAQQAGDAKSEAEPLLKEQAAADSSSASEGSSVSDTKPGNSKGVEKLTSEGSQQQQEQAGAGKKVSPPSRKPMVVKCGHVFCEACLSGWVEQQRKVNCPICRRDLDTGDEQPPPPPPSQRCEEVQPEWEQHFPTQVFPGTTQKAARLRLDTSNYYRTRTGQWRYRGTSGYTLDDLRHARADGLTQEEARQLFQTELLFRLTALRRRYPEYITPEMASTWGQDLQNGRELDARLTRALDLRDPSVQHTLEQSGARGSGSTGWGGGGGGGSSWGGSGGSW